MTHKILIIDDDPEIREILRQTLTKLGYKAGTAKSGEEGVERITRESFSLVLCDVMMPEMDGLETLDRIKKLDKALPVLMISGEGTHDRLIQAINKGAVDFISKPLNFIQMNQAIRKTLDPDSKALQEYASPVAHLMRDGYLTLLNMVTTLLEMKNTYMRNHSTKVAEYSRKIAMALKLPDDQIEVIYYASVLHDIGKVGISDAVLLKPGKLDEHEWTNMKAHPVIGRSMIEPIRLFRAEEPLIHHHHEWFDGSGYPAGLKADKIPLGARIISIADAYDAMTSIRPYRQAMDIKAAQKIIKEASGTQFDPEISKAFLSIA